MFRRALFLEKQPTWEDGYDEGDYDDNNYCWGHNTFAGIARRTSNYGKSQWQHRIVRVFTKFNISSAHHLDYTQFYIEDTKYSLKE